MEKKGFTLVELLVVIAVIGIIMTVATFSVVGILNREKNKLLDEMEKNLKEAAKAYIVQYEEEEAVRHLYHVCLGLCSQVLGDEQIIGQVGEALQWSRENKGTNQELEVLFRIGMTGAKELKSQIPFFQKNPTLSL